MDLEVLRQLVAQGESERLEFKKTTGELKDGMATVCAMLNGRGGRVLFGVTPSGKIVGQEVTDNTLQEVAQAIRKLEPPALLEQRQVRIRDKLQVLILETDPGPAGPYAFDGRAYQRVGPTTSRMPQAEYERLLLVRTHSVHRWESQPATGYTLDDLDTKEIEKTVRSAVEAGRLEAIVTTPGEALDRLHLRLDGTLLRAAVVLFSQRLLPDYPQCSLRMARFKGTTKTEFLDQRQLEGHAFRLLEDADLFLKRHLPVAGRIQPEEFERHDQPVYPPLGLREALVNALCHRDYSIPGGAMHVAIFDDRLEITSTGLLPPGITVADLKREHVSRPRNPLIAEVFFRRGLIERWGRGTQKIVELCVAAGQPEPEFEEQAGSVVVRFRPSSYVPALRVSHGLSARQREVLQILGDRKKWKVQDILARLAAPPAKRTLQDDLSLLRQFGLIESSGRGQGARWWLKPPQEATEGGLPRE
jgi:ATP-dependent DNA helicase RecG